MSKINDLIKELCPNGVEYKNIKELCRENFWVMPSTPNYQNKGIPYITSKNIKNGKVMFNNVKYITENDYKSISSNRPIKENDFLISMIGTIGEVGIVKKEDLPFYGQNMYLLRLNVDLINIKYFYHYFTSGMVRNLLIGEKNNGNQGYLKTKNIEMLKVPVPPLEVQEEIVKILDKFGELEAELEAELETRKSQYEFWRGKLLKGTKRYKLDDIAKFTYGLTDKALESGTARYIRITDISEDGYLLDNDCKYLNITDDNSKYVLNKGDLVVARTGASYGKTLYFDSDDPGIYASFLIKIELDNNIILNRYYWHFSKSALYWNQANNLVSKAGQPQFNSNAIKKLEIDIPSIEEQECIISILDKFDKLINDISIGLPAEIELRRKQYEYYRNKLLSFEELSVNE